MSSYPPGVTTAVIRVGTFVDFYGDAASVTAKVVPVLGNAVSHIVHGATGTVMLPASRRFDSDLVSGIAEFEVPHADAPGWLDPSGQTVSHWKYVVTVTATLNKGFGRSLTWTKEVQPLVGQTEIDLDLVPSAEVSGPISTVPAAVLSLNGQTGHVIFSGDGATDAALAANLDASKAYTDDELAENIRTFADASLAFAVVDEDGRRTWIEAGPDGLPTDYAAEAITDAIGPGIAAAAVESIGLTNQNTEITGVAFAVVDEDDRLTDIEIGPDGRFTQRVIDSLSDRIDPSTAAVPDPTTIISPASVPVVVGQEFRLYYSSFIGALDPAHTVLTYSGGQGANFGTYWQWTPTTARTVSLEIRVVDRAGAVVRSRIIAVQSYTAPSGTGKRHLAIGDSITRAGNYVGSAVSAFTGATTVGTRTYNNGALSAEGRGGWSLNSYFDNIGHETAPDSPFIFPIGVSGPKFWGNTQFWKRVCYEDTAGYDYAGFQRIARGWADSPAPFLYGTDGYPLNPAEGDIVVDPVYPEEDEFRQFTGGAWVGIPRPATGFSFSKYMARYAAAYPNGGPTSVSVMLETNDFFSGIDDAKFNTWKTRMDVLIGSVREYSATIPVIILLAPTGGTWDKWGAQTVNKWEFDTRMRDAAARIIAAYDTAAARTNRVYVASALGAVAPENISDWVHPSNPAGHDQLGRPLSGMLARLITEGIA